jgi:hypothetical protein
MMVGLDLYRLLYCCHHKLQQPTIGSQLLLGATRTQLLLGLNNALTLIHQQRQTLLCQGTCVVSVPGKHTFRQVMSAKWASKSATHTPLAAVATCCAAIVTM